MSGPEQNTIAYNLEDAARAVGMSSALLHRAIKAGDLPAKRTSRTPDGIPSGRIIVLRRDLEKWLEELPDDWWGLKYR